MVASLNQFFLTHTLQKKKKILFKDFFIKCEQILRKPQIFSHFESLLTGKFRNVRQLFNARLNQR